MIQFKDLTQNAAVYMLDKQTMTLTQGKVVTRGFPRMDINAGAGKSGMVVDVTIEAGGRTANYVIPESLSVTYAGDIVLSVDRQGLLGEVEAMKSAAEQALASVDRQRDVLAKATALMEELNPAFRERQETEQRFGRLEKSMDELKGMLAQFMHRDGGSRGAHD